MVSVSECSVIPQSIESLEFAGRNLNEYLMKLLTEERNLEATIGIARDIKEKLCRVSPDFEQEKRTFSISSEPIKSVVPLSNGQTLTLGSELFRCSEPLFQPSLLNLDVAGIDQAIYSSIMKCSARLQDELCNNIILAGGTTIFPGLAERLEKELRTLLPSGQSIKIVAPSERKYSSWLGGSIMASLTTFQAMWKFKQDYDECGPSLVHRKGN